MSYVQKFKDFVTECRRVLRVTRKPTKEEYKVIAKVSGIGLLIIGLAGFIFHIVRELSSIVYATALVIVLVVVLFIIKK
jgi:protein transport protein SEC61 subunit gamma and related proteins